MFGQKPDFEYIDQTFDVFVSQLQEAVRKPSIAAQNISMQEAAEHFRAPMEHYGISTRVIPTRGGYPCAYGEVKGQSDKTVLFYNHRDVQPPEPLDEWESDPFGGNIRDGKIYSRGVSDNKGNPCARIQAVGTMLKIRDELPLTVKFLVEREEGIGSPRLEPFIRENADLPKADYCVWKRGYMNPNGRLGMYLGVKGMLYVELIAKGPSKDMHSGSGATVPNPAWKLVWALSSINDANEKILIPGFYNDVLPPTEKDLELLSDAASDEKQTEESTRKAAERSARALGINSYLLNLYGLELRKRSLFSSTATPFRSRQKGWSVGAWTNHKPPASSLAQQAHQKLHIWSKTGYDFAVGVKPNHGPVHHARPPIPEVFSQFKLPAREQPSLVCLICCPECHGAG